MTKQPTLTAASIAKPFLKWAGGKGQLIPSIEAALPAGLDDCKNLVYVEPFAGSGAVLFWFLQRFPQLKEAIINDINGDLVIAYNTIKEAPGQVVGMLAKIQRAYYRLDTEEEKRAFFLAQRDAFNARSGQAAALTAQLIFLNRTCYNGLYRVNSRNLFNVPFGRYNKPTICDADNIMAVSELLQKVTILNGDYTDTLPYTSGEVFYYLDPPYKPISRTASFNSYAKNSFDDREQIRLKAFCDILTQKDIRWLLSNSDPRNHDPADNFFDELYAGGSTHIERVRAKRNINSNASKRGEIFELLISNYRR